ncbi:hypothetical protein CONPUDRAFT_157252 [Coniophora puteana RWD-64-598 SS2]|uniref:Uncharacterized protein n=1 Tax=Coniophora puteana (strain RWD-64-598) TaxID=741705 RepID=A0A5M3MGM2_CONPW|nr:uncharacterized protein CONPUDRAFT_157252 [Coniophora puteana RWD-64-598 SS2]EIW78090.1 hypothetical protein CONPUDRAFT_157252 [Coniophora puteana RWD-64-598 SS2]
MTANRYPNDIAFFSANVWDGAHLTRLNDSGSSGMSSTAILRMPPGFNVFIVDFKSFQVPDLLLFAPVGDTSLLDAPEDSNVHPSRAARWRGCRACASLRTLSPMPLSRPLSSSSSPKGKDEGQSIDRAQFVKNCPYRPSVIRSS